MDPDSGNALVKILTNQPDLLIAEQLTPTSSKALPLILLFAAVALAIYFIRIKYWKGQVVPVILLITAAFSYNDGADTYRMELDRNTGKIDYFHYYKGQLKEQNSVALANISSAEMQFNRANTRVALILKDGTQVLPLGAVHVQDAPNDYVILTAIRNAIGQVPAK